MDRTRNKYQSHLVAGHHIPSPEWREFLCGWGAAFINITVTFPINKVMFRQVNSESYRTTLKSPLINLFLLDATWHAYQDCLQTA